MEKIQAIMILEILGRPADYVSGSLNELVKKLGEEKGVKILKKQLREPLPVKESKELFTTFAELEVEFETLEMYLAVLFAYMPAHIEVLNPDNNLLSGMDADVTITTKKLQDVLAVPNGSVKPYQGGRAVRVPGKKKGEVEFIPVEVGIKGESKTQILKGIKEEQIVITSLSNEQLKRPGLFGG